MELKRLSINEHHDDAKDFPQEFLDMSIGDVLNKMSAIDTDGDAEYEILEAALIAIKPIMLADAKDQGEIDDTPIEDKDGDALEPGEAEEQEQNSDLESMPNFIETIGGEKGKTIEDFKF